MPTTHTKILSLESLASKAEELRQQGKRIVLCHGTFDLLHIGHIRHLQNARKEGDVLITTVTGDSYVNKGPGRPVFAEHLRSENLAALACVDFVAINQALTAINIISLVKPHAYIKGQEYKSDKDDLTGNIALERDAVEQHGGELIFTEDITFSSSSLLNENFGIFSAETKEYLQKIRKKYDDSGLIQKLKSLSRLKVMVIGDAIIDEYHYTTLLGQAGKGSHQSVKYESKEQFAGGALAVANHLAGFVESVTLVTGLGKGANHEGFIRSKLKENVIPQFHYFDDSPTIVKLRFVDGDLNKLFEVYDYNEQPTLEDAGGELCSWLESNTQNFDIVITPDFGNGFISQNMIKVLCDKSRFLAVNTQVNSGNRGYHVINHYPRADFISLNGPELRLATHNRYDPLEGLAEKVAKNLDAKYLAVTLGSKGALLLDREENTAHTIPVLSTVVLDRVGAGDSFLSLASLCLGAGLPSDIGLFVGSAAAALDVQIVCNREPISPVSLYKYITTLLK
ncbi:MAG: adenylyltransferase/cytidyltransferase family protein [Nitrospina sp.]|jgi:rfaE bifunctional protein nucleotidyltransferase chain/domain|nr:adenylyltransferase/cytidyltransferase family protein [Nitrospina sp.]